MSIMAICRSCGHKNPMGRMFCMQCGVSLSSAPATSDRHQGGNISAGGAGIGAFFKVIGTVIRWMLLIAIGFAIVLIFMPAVPQGATGDMQAAHAFQKKIGQLRSAMSNNKPIEQIFTEGEVNGYLAELMGPSRKGAIDAAFGIEPCQLNVKLRDSNEVTVVVMSRFRPLSGTNMSYQIALQVVPGKSGAPSVDVRSAKFGSLPMAGPLRDVTASRIAELIKELKLQDETLQTAFDFLNRVPDPKVQEGKIVLQYKGN